MSCSNCCPPVILGSGTPGPEGPQGPAGPPGEGVCVSTDPGNILQTGTDGCMYASAVPPLSAAACNAAEPAADGLLVPRVELEGVAPGGATSDERSVDVDVVGTPGCPQTWTVGARLAPVNGVAVREPCEWVDISDGAAHLVMTAELPAAGTYWLTADIRNEINTLGSTAGAFIYGGFFDVTSGVPISDATTLLSHVQDDDYSHHTASISYVYTVTGPTTVGVSLVSSETTAGTYQARIGCDANGRSRLNWTKIAD